LKAPIVIGRDHSTVVSVASPYRETESSSTAPTPSPTGPLLQRLVKHGVGGDVGVDSPRAGWDRSLDPCGQVCVADGTELSAQKLAKVLRNDPGMGVIRPSDAGYEVAENTAESERAHSDARG